MISVLVASPEAFPLPEEHLSYLNQQDDLVVLHVTGNVAQVIHAMTAIKPEVLLIDCQLVETLEPSELDRIYRGDSRSRVVVFCGFEDAHLIAQSLQQGARGFLTLTCQPADLGRAIRAVYEGDWWFNRKVLAELLQKLIDDRVESPPLATEPGSPVGSPETSHHLGAAENLTPRVPLAMLDTIVTEREREIIHYVSQGMTNKEIAKSLGISDKTVKAHLSHIFQKLRVNRRLKLGRLNS